MCKLYCVQLFDSVVQGELAALHLTFYGLSMLLLDAAGSSLPL